MPLKPMTRKPVTRKTMTRKPKQAVKVAVVTGGGTGIGRGIARRLAKDGFTVAVIGRRAARLRPKRGERWHAYVCDVADVQQIRDAVGAIRKDHGRIDVLINSAGVVQREPIEKTTQKNIDYTLGINLVGTMNFCIACIPALKRTKGSIVNISSSLTDRCSPQHSIYAASKGGVNAFSKSLAVELARHKIRVNVVSPSLVRSEIYFPDGMDRKTYAALFKASAEGYYPLGRSGEPSDIAALVSYLASPESAWVTGVVIPIDGGESVGLVGADDSGWST